MNFSEKGAVKQRSPVHRCPTSSKPTWVFLQNSGWRSSCSPGFGVKVTARASGTSGHHQSKGWPLGGPMSPSSPISWSPLPPFGPWDPTDTNKSVLIRNKCAFIHLTELTEKSELASRETLSTKMSRQSRWSREPRRSWCSIFSWRSGTTWGCRHFCRHEASSQTNQNDSSKKKNRTKPENQMQQTEENQAFTRRWTRVYFQETGRPHHGKPDWAVARWCSPFHHHSPQPV